MKRRTIIFLLIASLALLIIFSRMTNSTRGPGFDIANGQPPNFHKNNIGNGRNEPLASSGWINYLGNPVMDLGPTGVWDAQGISTPSVIVDGSVYKMWFS